MASPVAAMFVSTWVFHFGCPTQVITDCGRQFMSLLFMELMLLLRMTRLRSIACHPETDGFVERMHCHLKTSLMVQNNPSA